MKSSKVTDAIVVMDRKQGAVEMLASRGIRLHPIISMYSLLDVLLEAQRIDRQTAQDVRNFILDNHTFRYNTPSSPRSGRCTKAFPVSLMCTTTAVPRRGMVPTSLKGNKWKRRCS